MDGRTHRRAFTIIELLVVMGIILVLAGLLLQGISAARRYVQRARTQIEITNMMTALSEYFNEFSDYPPGGTDDGDDGKLDGPSDDVGAGKPNPGTDMTKLQLCSICTRLTIEGGNRTIGPYYNPNKLQMVDGAIKDVWGSSYRYLADGRRTTLDPLSLTGQRKLSRVYKRGPVIWSVAEDRSQDPLNGWGGENTVDPNSWDDDNNGKADDPPELVNDICSWN
jgi:prepilin-type N-terminal cleavage/methylation domain-containing protein